MSPTGKVVGIKLTREDRDEFRLGVDRMMLNRLKPCLLHSCFDVSYIPVVQKLTVHDQGDPDTEELPDCFVASKIYCFYCLFIMVYYLMHYVKPKQNKILVSEIIMLNTSCNHKKNELLILIT